MNATSGHTSPLVRLASLLLFVWPGPDAFSAEATDTNRPVLKYEEPRSLTGTIFAKDSDRKKALYQFARRATRNGSRLNVLREYSYPDGKVAARERVVYEGDALISYELEELQIGARGGAEVRRDAGNPAKGAISFQYTNAAGSKKRSEPLRNEILINDMAGPFLVAHWEALLQGQEVKCRYIVVPRRETVGFTFVKQSETERHGKPVLVVRMEPTSAIISVLVDPLFFEIEKEGRHRVLEYTGRTTPKMKAGNKWKDLDAVTVFDW